MAELNDQPNSQGGDAGPKRVDNLDGAPLPKPPAPGQPAAHNHVLESPHEAERRATHDKELHKDEQAGAALAATGLGCLSVALLPWSIGIVILIAVLLMWLFHGGGH